MKKIIYTLALIFSVLAYAADPQGIMSNVELLSGTKQRAQFMGIENDMVLLGGYIKNQFTVVRIAKDKFKSIVDDNGNDLLATATAPATAPEAPIAKADSSKNVATETPAVPATTDSTAVDSASTEPQPQTAIQLQSDKVFVAFEAGGDTVLLQQLNALTARLLLESGDKVQTIRRASITECNDDICIQGVLHNFGANTIYFGRIAPGTTSDSIALEITQVLFEEDLPVIHKSSKNILARAIMTDVVSNEKLVKLIQAAKGLETETETAKPKSLKSYIFIDTDPEGATVSKAENEAICRSPCTFTIEDTNKVVLNAYWNVENQIWGAQSTIRPIPGDTAKISLKLKPIKPEVQLITAPAGAEIFSASEEITKKSKAYGKTPNKFIAREPGITSFKLRKIGYKDTLVNVYVAPVPETIVNIEMEKLVDPMAMEMQQNWIHDRKMHTIGNGIMGASIAPVIIGAIFAYLGYVDYEDAKDIKNDLKQPGSMNGSNYQSKVQKNKDLVKDGDKKMLIGASLAGAGVVLLGIGFFVAF